ncbi:MAG: hypothetical protein EAX96_09975 [Candidatus Lokiarchaeota archaeon]|nr:hypothetical protein [Candidatus Lokiarchaeota archaeon]
MEIKLLNNIITAITVIISTIVLIVSIIFGILGMFTLIPLDPTIFIIGMILLVISFILAGYLIYQIKQNNYRAGYLFILVFTFNSLSLIFLILSYLGLYQVLELFLFIAEFL